MSSALSKNLFINASHIFSLIDTRSMSVFEVSLVLIFPHLD